MIFSIIGVLSGLFTVYMFFDGQIINWIVKKNKKNHFYAPFTFTDREEDIENVMRLLNEKQKVIGIVSEENQCGKSWFAMKICDIVNHPKSKNNKDYTIPKCIVKKAKYFDIAKQDYLSIENELNQWGKQQNKLVVLDHLTDIQKAITLQKNYNFFLIYINKGSGLETEVLHVIKGFKEHYIYKLHSRIRKNFKDIEELTIDEIKTLHKLTNGNIRYIYCLLSRQESVFWIKTIHRKEKTKYDDEFNKIQMVLYNGNYKKAESELKILEQKYRQNDIDDFKTNRHLFYEFQLLNSDAQHLLNNYQEAINIVDILLNSKNPFSDNELLMIKKAHYLKHIWKAEEALTILEPLSYKKLEAASEKLGILSSSCFIADETDFYKVLNEYKRALVLAQKLITPETTKDKIYRIERHKIIIEFYENKLDFDTIHEKFDIIIQYYKNVNSRLVANSIFLKGEFYRLEKQYNEAIVQYDECLSITDDDNIKIQVHLMKKYLKLQNHCLGENDVLSNQEILNLCEEHSNQYGKKLFHKINSIKNGDPTAIKIVDEFERRIMTIL